MFNYVVRRILATIPVMVVVALFVAGPVGLLAACQAGSFVVLAIRCFAALGFSVPVSVVGYLLAYVFALQFEWLPVEGYTPIAQGLRPWLANLVLPSIALGCV